MRCPPLADDSRFMRPVVDDIAGSEDALPARGVSDVRRAACGPPPPIGERASDVGRLEGAALGSATELLRSRVSVKARYTSTAPARKAATMGSHADRRRSSDAWSGCGFATGTVPGRASVRRT